MSWAAKRTRLDRSGAVPQPAINDGPKALACPLRCRYSLHRDAPWGPGDNRRPVLLPHLRQGASQPQFPAILGLRPTAAIEAGWHYRMVVPSLNSYARRVSRNDRTPLAKSAAL